MTPKEMTYTHVQQNITRLLRNLNTDTDQWHELLYGDEERDVFEHWTVSEWLAEKLIEKGEFVGTDFYGLSVWGRTTTGQSVKMDGVIQEIADELSG